MPRPPGAGTNRTVPAVSTSPPVDFQEIRSLGRSSVVTAVQVAVTPAGPRAVQRVWSLPRSSTDSRWLMIVGRREQASNLLSKLRGLGLDHERVRHEIDEIQASVQLSNGSEEKPTLLDIVKETFTKRSNLRRLQQTLVSYALAQLSGANSITSYFVPYMAIISPGGGTTRDIFLSGMYGFSKFWFSMLASFVFIDAFGRRNSLFIGASLQMVSDIYIGIFIRYQQHGPVSLAASECAVAMLFIHALGYSIGE